VAALAQELEQARALVEVHRALLPVERERDVHALIVVTPVEEVNRHPPPGGLELRSAETSGSMLCVMPRHATLALAVVVTLLGVTAPVVARALPGGVDARAKAEAKVHYDKGVVFYNAQLYDDAFKEFQTAYLAFPAPDFLFNMGQALRLGKKPADALAAYERYLHEYPEGQDHVQVEGFIEQLKVEAAAVEQAERERIEREKAERERIEREKAERERIERERIEREKALKVPPKRIPHPLHAYTLIGLGVVVGAVGGGLMAWAANTSSEYDQEYGACFGSSMGPCTGSHLPDLRQRGQILNIVGPSLVGAGGALVVTGAILWAVHHRKHRDLLQREEKKVSTGVSLVPELLPGGGGLGLVWVTP
jgi:tetratricopeptide (TPR) repeat protein